MDKEKIKELARESMLETLKTNLDSAMIFTYVKSLEDRINKAIEYINTHSLNVNGEIEDVLEVEECEDLLDILRGNDEKSNE